MFDAGYDECLIPPQKDFHASYVLGMSKLAVILRFKPAPWTLISRVHASLLTRYRRSWRNSHWGVQSSP